MRVARLEQAQYCVPSRHVGYWRGGGCNYMLNSWLELRGHARDCCCVVNVNFFFTKTVELMYDLSCLVVAVEHVLVCHEQLKHIHDIFARKSGASEKRSGVVE